MSKIAGPHEQNQGLIESCLEHVEDFEDGPVWFGKGSAEIAKKTWWTKHQKAVFISLIGRKGISQLEKIANLVQKSPAECEMYLGLLQSAIRNEPSLPALTYLDIPAAIETNEEEEVTTENEAEQFSKVVPGSGSLLNYSALMKRFNCVLTAEAAQSIEEAVIERLKCILYYCQFCPSGPADVDYMLDQYFEVYADPVCAETQETADRLDSEDSEDEAQIELEDMETTLLDKFDNGQDALELQASSELATYMNLNP